MKRILIFVGLKIIKLIILFLAFTIPGHFVYEWFPGTFNRPWGSILDLFGMSFIFWLVVIAFTAIIFGNVRYKVLIYLIENDYL